MASLSVWQRIDSTDTFSSITSVNNTLFLSTKKKVFTINADTFHAIYTCDTFIEHIGPGNNSLLIGVASKSGGGLKIMDLNFGIIDSFDCSGASAQAVQLSDNSLWVALPRGGLKKRTGINQTNYFFPDGPSGPYSFDLYAFNKTLYIAHGGYNTTYSASGSIEGASYFSKGKWTYYKHGDFHPFDYTRDYVALAKDESTGTLYIGSYLNGLLIVNGDGTSTPVDETVFDGSDAYGPTVHQILSLALDHSNNLWITTMFAKHQLYVKTPDNIWDSFKLPHINYGGCVITDDSGQVWMGGSSADGLAVLNTNKTISDKTDDASFHIGKGAGFGNLPGTGVACLAKDKKNQIWAGTENGIAVFTNCIATNSSSKVCEATIPIANFGAHPGPLFEGRNVITIAVDGADRKWVGTHEGVWLLSPDGQNMIYNFTRDNSPLPSNNVQKITIDKATGDVYIGTDMGVVSYHSTATEGASNNQKAEVFPNPVPGGYTGTIAIRGLVTNADVRITDIDGQLVYRTKALGGQAVWSGRDYNGHRPQSGVYLFFVSDSDGKQTYTGKIVFIQ